MSPDYKQLFSESLEAPEIYRRLFSHSNTIRRVSPSLLLSPCLCSALHFPAAVLLGAINHQTFFHVREGVLTAWCWPQKAANSEHLRLHALTISLYIFPQKATS